MNDSFDLMNSRSVKEVCFKGSLWIRNQNVWRIRFEECKEYLRGLSNAFTGQNLLIGDPKKTGFLGIYCNFEAVTKIFDNVVVNGPLSYILTYKMSQDHLEHYFGLVRARFGANNNPTPFQFRHIYRRLLLGITNLIVKDSNVIIQDNSELVAIVPSAQDRIDYITDHYNLEDLNSSFIDSDLSDFKDNVTEYIAGFVIKKLSCKLSCDICRSFVMVDKPIDETNLISLKDYGNFMIYPSLPVKKIVRICEKIITFEVKRGKWLTANYFCDYLNLKVIKAITSQTNILDSMKCQMHCYSLLKSIISCYSVIRLKHHAKLENQKIKKQKMRSYLNKIVINMGQ